MKAVVISSFGAQNYAEKYIQAKLEWRNFWDAALFVDGSPLDVVDFAKSRGVRLREKSCGGASRHVYVNGLVLGNILQEQGHDTTIINAYDEGDTKQKTMLLAAELVVISTNYVTGRWVNELCSLVAALRACGSTATVVVGGFGVYRLLDGDMAEERCAAVMESGVDVLIEGRHGIGSLLKVANSTRLGAKRIIRDEDDFRMTPEHLSARTWPLELQSPHTVLFTSTGCPFTCHFCSYRFFLGEYAPLPIREVRKMLDATLRRSLIPVSCLRVVDECFNVPEDRAVSVCREIRDVNADLIWCCFARGDRMTPRLARELRSSGCALVSIGLESGVPEMQRTMNKNLDLAGVKETVAILRDEGIQSVVSLLVGFYGESISTVERTRDYLVELRPDLARINVWVPPPGEAQQALAREFGFRVCDGSWAHRTMSEIEACDLARSLYKETPDISFVPPFSSIFDQWPELIGRGLTPEDALMQFLVYHRHVIAG